ncbi:hypothetical protein JNUCC0626_40195 [Lentzea sp. JNUCC 0626]|uniref:hypothetical protein n=1 Tax=Lentzea sp. JNUCC 0626 TaxID=3367513 RepID=UPI0037485CB8
MSSERDDRDDVQMTARFGALVLDGQLVDGAAPAGSRLAELQRLRSELAAQGLSNAEIRAAIVRRMQGQTSP